MERRKMHVSYAIVSSAVMLIGIHISTTACGAAFSPGNLAIFRVGQAGDGSNVTSNGEPVFIDEYSRTGTLVQSIPLSTVTSGAQRRFITSGALGEGLLNRSPDGKWLTFLGYDASLGTTSLPNRAPTSNPRVLARIDGAGNIDTSTSMSDLGGGNNNSPFSAITTDGNQFTVTANSTSLRYASLGQDSTTPYGGSQNPGLRHVDIFGGRLFVSAASSISAASMVAEVLPTGQLIYLPGVPAPEIGVTPSQFWMADLSPSVPGVDVLYLTEQHSLDSFGGIRKFSLVNGTWNDNGRIAPPSQPLISNISGVTGEVTAGEVSLFATRPGSLLTFIDTSGYNGAVNGIATLLATAPANTQFRGIDSAPVPDHPIASSDFNEDGVVDAHDLAEWKSDFGGAGSDATGDGITDGADFLHWQREFNAPPVAVNVPEPSCAILTLSTGAVTLIASRRVCRPLGTTRRSE